MTPDFEQQSLLVFIVGLFAVLGAVASGTAILKNIALYRATKKPSDTEAAVREFATKHEVAALRCEWQTSCKANHDRNETTFTEIFGILRAQQNQLIARMDENTKQLIEWQRGVERQLGIMEGRIES